MSNAQVNHNNDESMPEHEKLTDIQSTTAHSNTSFPPTMWTQVMQLRDASDPQLQQDILNRLCLNYWQPLFQYARRSGNSPEHAQDLTQGFFVQLLRHKLFDKANRERGKLRTLLLTGFKHYIHDEYDKSVAVKRGGTQGLLSLDALEDAEQHYQLETHKSKDASPDAIYDRRCARDCMEAAAQLLEQRYAKAPEQYVSLRQFLTVAGNEASYSAEALKLKLPGGYGHYKVLVQRFRDKFKDALLDVVKGTLPDEATDEDVRQEVLEIIRLAYG